MQLEEIIKILQANTRKYAAIRIIIILMLNIVLRNTIDTVAQNKIIAIVAVVLLDILLYFVKLKKDVELIKTDHYKKWFYLFVFMAFALELVDIEINFNNMESIVYAIVFLFPLHRYFLYAKKDENLSRTKRIICSIIFYVLSFALIGGFISIVTELLF